MLPGVFLDDALAHHAKTTPQANAINLLGEVTSYHELNAQTDEIARHLLMRGLRRGDRVLICAAKSPRAIAAICAILRVGAIYVPIDPAAPPERAALQAETIAPELAIVDDARVQTFEQILTPEQILSLDQPISNSAAQDQLAKRQGQRSVNDPAYILMTSGTTGTPKGIVHTHSSGLAYAKMAAHLCELSESDRVSHHTPTHFDMSIFDIFSTALAGACVVIIPEMHSKLPASLSALAEAQQITVWYSVPYALIQLTERGALDARDLSALRVVMFAGEKMPPPMLQAFADHVPHARFINAYGPTETNHCTTARFTRDDLDGVSPLPIGYAADGIQARIGDEPEEPEVGELLIASEQIMQGYWRDPVQTDAAFCFLPDRDGVERTFYRTGDIVRRDTDGQFQLIGRKDRQVKLRGFRIELDEVELALVTQPEISEAVVVLAKQELHAFVSGPSAADPDHIRRQVAATLPRYAIPQRIEWLAAMPRTSTGKIDRRKLMEKANARHAA